ncbi:MBL fold metallo-hydrolase [Bauldia litoralis]|uniref:Metallo-beta-lactamase superfamily protein n=1 Tax=Bauldia litoralis TaxID=665467 RepID=A0A1G6AEN7_9HYPH|nr:MBL fold metallo-hydrolase [Bauldia litoralis]SDB06770.1 Metallo-beta-lactamase superfamily protein [Bauldia litoralis]
MREHLVADDKSSGWRSIIPGVELYSDSCNVYAVSHPGGTIFINAGTGYWLDDLPARFRPPFTLLCTHFFRDHSAGAARAGRQGMRVFAPAGELEIFSDPAQHFRERKTYIIYDNVWDTFAPIEPTAALPAHDYETLDVDGLAVTVVALPGVTPNHAGYALTLPDSGRRIAFSGEAIHSPGRMARIAPLQYDYNDLGGAVNAYWSAGELRRGAYDALMPSLGTPILETVDAAVAALETSLEALCAGRPLERKLLPLIGEDTLERVTDHVWVEPLAEASSWYLISDGGKALAIDYGYKGGFGLRPVPTGEKNWQWPAYSYRARRRVLLHGLPALKRQFGIDRIDVALIGHFHDDHVAGVPLLQRISDTQCWVPENFAPLLTHPEAHRFPCNWPEPARIDRVLGLGETFTWEEYTIRIEPMSGHTRFSVAILFEADGKRFAHTGDQYFFRDRRWPEPEDWSATAVIQNHVYQNGATVESYRESARILAEWRPDIVITGHQQPMYTDDAFFDMVDRWGETYAELHENAMVLGADERHFGLDSWGGWIWPYRSHVAEGEPVNVNVTVRNPLNEPAKLTVRLVGPPGWSGTTASVDAGPRAEVSCDLSIHPSGPCRRQPIAAELSVGADHFGQVVEALATVGGSQF